ncbi:MBL fold metallo-hydrolase [Nonomuraea bangladeshensis]|uniref:MBL fold metallo-hydrolase n=1 Tax=Nonomuraea bangladeshensis TaxID=404385 RepID=UPI003C2B1697
MGHTVTSGTFSLDGQTFDVDNNVWVLGDDSECVIFDAPHDVEAIIDLAAGRDVLAFLATHAHDDHIRHAQELAERTGAPVLLHPADLPLWRLTHPDREPDGMLAADQIVKVAGTSLQVLHTPGHTPGACSFYAPDLGAVFTGDTLFQGGPGATGRSFSDFDLIIDSVRHRLLTLPPETTVHTGHGTDTTIGAETPHLEEWIRRGH